MRTKFITGGVLVGCAVVVLVINYLYYMYRDLLETYEDHLSLTNRENSWFFHLLLNMFGYCSVLVPGFILYIYIQKTNYFEYHNMGSGVYRALYPCFGPHDQLPERAAAPAGAPAAAAGDFNKETGELMFCFTGLMGAYLVWGLLQEKIMTQEYKLPDGSMVRFSDSQFLVLVNRASALAVAAARLRCTRRPLVAAPLYKFAYCSLTNVVSTWCQYEALKYVSFPTQVLSKSCKVIPVMLMGIVVSRNKYQMYEYVSAAFISLGMAAFLFGSHRGTEEWVGTSLSGGALLVLYMECDAFTSSWQTRLFAQYKVSPLQMLCAVNLCSCLLLHRAVFTPNWAMLQHPGFLVDLVLLSASSTVGQLIIYRTIARFGAVVFTIMMTLRQAASILLSCLVYGHSVSASGAAGIVLVFLAVLLRVYGSQRLRRKRDVQPSKQQGQT